jgi:hypothetical protein
MLCEVRPGAEPAQPIWVLGVPAPSDRSGAVRPACYKAIATAPVAAHATSTKTAHREFRQRSRRRRNNTVDTKKGNTAYMQSAPTWKAAPPLAARSSIAGRMRSTECASGNKPAMC